MFTQNTSIATHLHCSPMPIPEEYVDKAKRLSIDYAKHFSLSGLYTMSFDIVYNRTCNLINSMLLTNSDFSNSSFDEYVNESTLFYNMSDIETIAKLYKNHQDTLFPYILCFFGKKLKSFKRKHIAYTKGLDSEDIDEVLVIAVHKTLLNYHPENHFSFAYLDKELFAAITELGGEMCVFKLPRNDYVNYLKFCHFIDKYKLTSNNIEEFLSTFNSSKDTTQEYSCNITFSKAKVYYNLYSIEHMGISCVTDYDEENDRAIDNSGGVIDFGYEDIELKLFAEQLFALPNELRIFQHLTEPNGAVFSNKELSEDYQYTRYALSKMKDLIKNELL